MPSLRSTRFLGIIILLILVSAGIAGCSGFSLAADITPPPDYTPPAPQQAAPVVVSTAFPLLPPDPKNGAAIFVAKCLPCHGATGMGDGPQAANLPSRPAQIGDPDFAHKSRPADWYQVVTDGNLKSFMPGFQGSLDDRQRWDVIAYVYTLSSTPAQLDEAKVLYASNCASCHGDTGRADGLDAPGKNVFDWGQQNRLSQLSANKMDQIITSGQNAMPAYADLSADQRFGLIDYIRTLSFSPVQGEQAAAATPTVDPAAGTATAGPAGTPAAEVTPASGTPVAFVGKVTLNGKISGENGLVVPPSLDVSLITFEGMNQVANVKATSGADGTFSFEVDNKAGVTYMAQVTFNGLIYNSDILHSTDISTSSANLPVTIYETSTDLSTLSIDRVHIFFDFSKPATVQVAELFIISNSGTKVVVAAGPDKPVLSFKLPAGAANLQFDNGAIGDRYVQTADGFGDLAAIAPGQGQHQVLFSYDMAYPDKLDLKLPVPMAVNAAVVMMPQGGVQLKSSQFQSSGSRDVQGETYQLYTASAVASGGELSFSLSGNPLQSSGSSAGGSSTNNLLIGLGVFGLALIAVGVWLFRQRATAKLADGPQADMAEGTDGESEDALIDAILALDDLHQAGKLPDDAYTQRRADLKDRLRVLRGAR